MKMIDATKQQSIKTRFEGFYIKGPGCWEWNAKIGQNGYGVFSIGKKKFGAHRVSFEIYVEEIPSGIHVCHKCDNPICVRPDHLFLGTHRDNQVDKLLKGRARGPNGADRLGEKNPHAKLSDADVLKIMNLLSSGTKQRKIANQFGISNGTVSHINTGRRSLPNSSDLDATPERSDA